jgi:hypothetical protein
MHAEWNQSRARRRLSAKGARRGQHVAHAHVLYLFSEFKAEDDIAVAEQVARELVEGNPQLLSVHSAVGWTVTLK